MLTKIYLRNYFLRGLRTAKDISRERRYSRANLDTLIIQSLTRPRLLPMPLVGLFMLILLSGCATTPSYSTTQVQSINLEPQALKTYGIAFITPTTITGQEEDKQALALVFTETLKQARPNLRIISLPATLGVISREGLANEYKRMFEDYLLTGIFNQDTLEKISPSNWGSIFSSTQTCRIQSTFAGSVGISWIKLGENRNNFLEAISPDLGR